MSDEKGPDGKILVRFYGKAAEAACKAVAEGKRAIDAEAVTEVGPDGPPESEIEEMKKLGMKEVSPGRWVQIFHYMADGGFTLCGLSDDQLGDELDTCETRLVTCSVCLSWLIPTVAVKERPEIHELTSGDSRVVIYHRLGQQIPQAVVELSNRFLKEERIEIEDPAEWKCHAAFDGHSGEHLLFIWPEVMGGKPELTYCDDCHRKRVSGVVRSPPLSRRLGHSMQTRNEPCACGSGKKYKRCCGRR
jgi:hypothetical protein